MRLRIFIFSTLLFVLSCSHKQKVSLMLYNATIYTVDSSFSVAEAMVVGDGKVIAVGTRRDMENKYDAEEKVDVEGKFIYPGFIDAHAHFVEYGQSLFTVDLYDSKSIDEVVKRVKDFDSTHPGEKWILGR